MTQDTGQQRYFEDVWPGDEFAEEQQWTTEDVLEFMQLNRRNGSGGDRGNTDGRFTDAAGARRQGLDRPIVPGNMSSALLTRLVTDWAGPLGRLRSVEVSFRRPVLHGDRLRAVALVTDASDADGTPKAMLDLYLENDRGERPLQGAAVVELPRRGQPQHHPEHMSG